MFEPQAVNRAGRVLKEVLWVRNQSTKGKIRAGKEEGKYRSVMKWNELILLAMNNHHGALDSPHLVDVYVHIAGQRPGRRDVSKQKEDTKILSMAVRHTS